MGRAAVYSDREIIGAATRLVAGGGPQAATMQAVARAVGAPTGSIYHRFASRDVLMARLWLELVADFQAGFLAALDAGDGLAAVLHTPRWVRANRVAARALLLYRSDELIAGGWPKAMAGRAKDLRQALEEGLRAFAGRLGHAGDPAAMRSLRFGLMDAPYAAVRPYLSEAGDLPAEVDRLLEAAWAAVVSLLEGSR